MINMIAGMANAYKGVQAEKDREEERQKAKRMEARQAKFDKIALDRGDREARDDAEAQGLKADLGAIQDQQITPGGEAPADGYGPVQGPSVSGTGYRDNAEAQAAVTQARSNAEQGIYRGRGMHDKARQLGRDDLQNQRADTTYAQGQTDRATRLSDEQVTRAKFVKSEGMDATAKAALTGNAKLVFDTFNSGGTMKLKDVPTMRMVKVNIPGIGGRETPEYTGVAVSPDGTETPFTKTAHQLNMERLSYDKVLEVGIRGTEADSRGDARVAQAESAALRASMATGGIGGGRGGSGGRGIDVKQIDDYLTHNLKGADEDGKPSPVNPQVRTLLRNAAMRMPGADMDPVGAVARSHEFWNMALKSSGGDVAKASVQFNASLYPPATEKTNNQTGEGSKKAMNWAPGEREKLAGDPTGIGTTERRADGKTYFKAGNASVAGSASKQSQEPMPTAPARIPVQNKDERITQIEQALKANSNRKFDMRKSLMEQGLPLGMSQKFELESELKRLKSEK